MKKIFYFCLVCVIAALSCSKEITSPEEETPATGKVPVTFSVNREEIKTYVDSDGATLLWEEGDKIGVFTNLDTDAPCEFTMSGEPGSSATFTGSVTEGASSFYVFYPYDENATFADGKITTSLPTNQTIGSNNTAKGAMLTTGFATGTGANLSVTLTPVFAYLKFKIQTEDVKTIVIGSGSVNFGGEAQFTADGGAMVSGGSANSITITKESGYFAKDTYYYVPVLPVTVPAGEFTFAIDSNTHGSGTGTDGYDDWKAERAATSAMAFTQGGAKKFDALDADGSTNKWSWYFDIHDAASLERFRALVGAGKFPSTANGGIAKLTSDINLNGVTLAAAAGTFSGTLDGQNHSITGWTGSGKSLFNLVTGTVKNLTVASSCTLSFPTPLTGSFGFICVDVQSAGKLDNITFNASVSQSGLSVTGGTYYGLLAGRCYGLMENCTNNGDLSLTVSSVSSGNVYLGGMVGYFNSGDKRAAYRNTNNGNVSYRVNAKGNFVFLGGITAGTSTNKIAEATSSKGTIQECVNTGNISYYCTNGGSMDDNAGTGGTGNYFKVGGVAGYWEGNIIDCTNGVNGDAAKGQVSVTVPTNESTACATGPSIGGVAAFVLRNMTGCKNYGTVSIKGTFAGGGTSNAGNGVTAEFAAGGVVGQIGPAADAGTYALSDCHNYGTLDFKGWMAYGNGTGFNFGGVAGFSVVPVSACSNNGAMTAESKGAYVRMGGVVGYAYSATATVSDLTNNGNLEFSLKRSTAGAIDTYKQLSQQLRIGGVVGFANSTASSCVNNNPMTLTTTAADNLSANLQIGGVVGYAGSTVSGTNNEGGDITITYSGTQVKCGGVLGEGVAQSLGNTCKNYGDLDITCGSIKQSWFGGVFGSIPVPGSGTNTHSGLENHGDISLTITTSQDSGFYYLGGVAGTSAGSQVFTNCKNYGDLTYTGHAKIRIGGINAYMNQTANGSVVECDITASCTGRDYSEVGGVSAYTAATGLTNWSYKGTINTSGSTKKVYTGGLLGKSNGASAFNGCTFEGTLTGATGNNVPGLYVGGLQSNNLAMKFGNSSKCVVKSGAVVNGTPVTSLTKDNLVSQSSDGGTYTSTATLTNIVIE